MKIKIKKRWKSLPLNLVLVALLVSPAFSCKSLYLIPSADDGLTPIADAPAIVNYGRFCEAEIGPVPPLNCLDGNILAITVDGREVRYPEQVGACDRPVILGVDSGPCTTGSRLLRVDTGDADTELVMICRRYVSRPEDSPIFDDIAVIHHRRSTGATCFYQMPKRATPATRIPPPAELGEKTPTGHLKAEEFWLTPAETADRKCYFCHDSDPFIYNPYIAQAGVLPDVSQGKYMVLGDAFAAWPEVQAVASKSQPACTSCHRIGLLDTCRSLSYVSGQGLPFGGHAGFMARPEAIWMPPDHGARDWDAWHQTYGAAYDAIAKCCQNPAANDCVKQTVMEFLPGP